MKPTSKNNQPCERCGSTAAKQCGDHWLCLDCYEVAGSCCLEFGAADLWEFEDDQRQAA